MPSIWDLIGCWMFCVFSMDFLELCSEGPETDLESVWPFGVLVRWEQSPLFLEPVPVPPGALVLCALPAVPCFGSILNPGWWEGTLPFRWALGRHWGPWSGGLGSPSGPRSVLKFTCAARPAVHCLKTLILCILSSIFNCFMGKEKSGSPWLEAKVQWIYKFFKLLPHP